jgi:hypothetical protein
VDTVPSQMVPVHRLVTTVVLPPSRDLEIRWAQTMWLKTAVAEVQYMKAVFRNTHSLNSSVLLVGGEMSMCSWQQTVTG